MVALGLVAGCGSSPKEGDAPARPASSARECAPRTIHASPGQPPGHDTVAEVEVEGVSCARAQDVLRRFGRRSRPGARCFEVPCSIAGFDCVSNASADGSRQLRIRSCTSGSRSISETVPVTI